MRRFIITTDKYTGAAELWYQPDGSLTHIIMADCGMNAKQRQVFKDKAPVLADGIEAFAKGLNLTVVEADFEATFDMFWAAYQKKINKARCLPLWTKLTKTDQVKAWAGIKSYDKYLKRESWRGKADPENYLRNKMWENEY